MLHFIRIDYNNRHRFIEALAVFQKSLHEAELSPKISITKFQRKTGAF